LQLNIVILETDSIEQNRQLINEIRLNRKIIDLLGSTDGNLSGGAAGMLAAMVDEETLMAELTKQTNQELIGKVLRSEKQLVIRAALLLTNAYIIKGKPCV
jgi:hypothetical protein